MELEGFLENWRKELQQLKGKRRHESLKILAESSAESDKEHYSLLKADEGPEEKLCRFDVKQNIKSPLPTRDTPSLFVLPQSNSPRLQQSGKEPDVLRGNECAKPDDDSFADRGRLIDQLISDLNEITTIPFFDIQLPKEVALMIFSFLGIQDLCSCALVSKSWSVLAQDNSLWMLKCQAMGYNTESSTEAVHDWKSVVKEVILRERRIQQNWRERVCEISDYQPPHTGTLCCAVYDSGQILSCYSCGEVCVWSLGCDGTGSPVRITLPASFSRDVLPITAAMKGGVATLTNSSGFLHVLDLNSCQTIHSVKDTAPFHAVSIGNYHTHYSIAAATGGAKCPHSGVMVLSSQDSNLHHWSMTKMDIPPSISVNQVSLVESDKQQVSHKVLYSTNTSLSLQSPFVPYSKALHLVTTPTEGRGVSYVSSFSHLGLTAACGIFDFDCNQVRLYDLNSGAFKQSFKGHRGKINCVEFESKDFGMGTKIVSGGNDKRVMVCDQRRNAPVVKLIGHTSSVLCTQIEDWKVVSGSEDGQVVLWDLRKNSELWHVRERHSTSMCQFDDNYLITSHIPKVKMAYDPNSSLYIKQRGLVRVYDFSVDRLSYTRKLPPICSSNYDEPAASFHHLDLRVPYDSLEL